MKDPPTTKEESEMAGTVDHMNRRVFGSPGQRIRSALYLDFDNIFTGLMNDDPQLAMQFAQDPAGWVSCLSTAGLRDGQWRDFLVRRCYLNPSGSMVDGRLEGGSRINFARFRQSM